MVPARDRPREGGGPSVGGGAEGADQAAFLGLWRSDVQAVGGDRRDDGREPPLPGGVMAHRKVLYAIFVPPGRARMLLDTVRLFARPTAKYPAHVTVRGPYEEPADPTEWDAVIRGQL